MEEIKVKEALGQLFADYTGEPVLEYTLLVQSGSNRQYYRLRGAGRVLVGTYGPIRAENISFYTLAEHFYAKGLPVPKVYVHSADFMCYLQEDLGDDSLYAAVSNGRELGFYSERESELLCKAMAKLPDIQFLGAQDLDFSVCYPQPAFDRRMIMFDLNYFKYCFLKTIGLDFNEIRLEDDFEKMADILLETPSETFLFRDFQARNVMLRQGEPYFIDFQGGRRGPIYYDIASFVWQAKAQYPTGLKHQLQGAYLKALQKYMAVDVAEFSYRLRHFVLFRALQTLGAYGFRGNFEKKPHFLDSIPFAMENIRTMLKATDPYPEYPYLTHLLQQMIRIPQLWKRNNCDKHLVIDVYSFAYKKGIPDDVSGNGGGYVFDCRAINNPGKYDRYKQLSGRDDEVIKFLEDDGGVFAFLNCIYPLADMHVPGYIKRGFTHLQFAFGCTGGQHRSVYCAERLAWYIKRKYAGVQVNLTHVEQGNVTQTL